MREVFIEVFAVMRNNRMRLLLTGFSIGWGLFILIIMLGSGNGVIRGVSSSFGTDTVCVLYISQGTTSMAWHGQNPQRDIILHEADADAIAKAFPQDVRSVMKANQSPIIDVTAGERNLSTLMTGCPIGYYQTEVMKITEGRDFTRVDEERHNRVCLLGRQTVDILFGKEEHPIGQEILANGMSFRVVGVYDSPGGYGSGHVIYIPFNTCKDLFVPDGVLSQMVVVAENVRNEEQLQIFKGQIYGYLANRLEFNPNDKIALSVVCYTDQFFQLKTVLDMIHFFIWIVGLATLISGIVGVSNIMVIGIRERTREFGVRLAMGASDLSIMRLVLIESVIVTVIFGYLGMMAGVGLTQALDWTLKQVGGVTYFENPTVDFTVLMIALLIMVVAGLLAGFIPARQAVQLKLVDALNS